MCDYQKDSVKVKRTEDLFMNSYVLGAITIKIVITGKAQVTTCTNKSKLERQP